jgi:small conductance mechanosensitive channel
VLDVRVAANTDIDRAIEVARAAAHTFYEGAGKREDVLEPPEVLGVESFLEGAIVLRVTVKTSPGKQYEVARALRVALRRAFDAADISMNDITPPAPPATPPKPG